jgi:ubiquinone/menaquinone biosynthesis C-methylase UbiE
MSQDESIETTERKQRVTQIFNGAAPVYDQSGPQFFTHYGRRLVEVAEIPAGSTVLDVASGRGAALFPASKAVGSGGIVVGIDLSDVMIKETAQEISRLKMPGRIEVIQMDAEYLEFPDDSFDYVICGFAIFFFPQLYQALGEFLRVLKPGGIVCVSTFDKSFNKEWTWLYDIADTYLPPDPEEEEETESESEKEPGPVFGTPDGLKDILSTAGFGDIKILSEGRDFVYKTEEEFWSTLWSHGFRRILQAIEDEKGEEELHKFKAEVFTKMSSMMESDGYHQSIAVHFGLATKTKVD